LGVGVGGLADGIFFHQLLQWHHTICDERSCLVTNVVDLRAKIFTDGLFHAFCWVMLVAGIAVLARNPNQSFATGRALWGAILCGWGIFNLIEGLLNHHLLGLHHVRFGPGQTALDVAFLALGAVLLITGWVLYRSVGENNAV
jgi:uncharacterized membrane protein